MKTMFHKCGKILWEGNEFPEEVSYGEDVCPFCSNVIESVEVEIWEDGQRMML